MKEEKKKGIKRKEKKKNTFPAWSIISIIPSKSPGRYREEGSILPANN